MSNATAKSGKPKTPTSEKSGECTYCGKHAKNGTVQYDAADQRHIFHSTCLKRFSRWWRMMK